MMSMHQHFVQVPLFQHMDELVLENICDRVKSLVFTKGETVSSKLHSIILYKFIHYAIYYLLIN